MFDITKKSIQWGGRTLTIESGRIARQADGAVMITYGGTELLCTATAAKKAKPDMNFFPLTINYQEKFYAAGRIPGGFFKREGRPSEKDTLTSRLIDRPIRPLFPEEFRNETQVICSLLSHDKENDPDIIGLVGASAALTISGIPFFGPIGGARVGYVEGEYVLNPTPQQLENSEMNLVVAGTQSSVLMVESEANELPEDIMLGAVKFGHEQMQVVIDLIISVAEDCAKEPWDIVAYDKADELKDKVVALTEKDFRKAYGTRDKQERSNLLNEIRSAAKEKLSEDGAEYPEIKISDAIKKIEKDIVRTDIIKSKKRIDGRTPVDVRQIVAEVGVVGKSHGSALFTRGETQALVITTLGTGQDQQIIDAVEGEYKDSFMLHYNFPPYSVGEVGFMRGPGRREIGHGKLALRAINAMIPSQEKFPYTLRVVSEITESNGSSSMATVCGTSLALMDAGVPLERSISGIAMGLIKEGDDFVVLSDILGDEDHLGDMDFKVAGTEKGITALQMDIKIDGITFEIMEVALDQAKGGRNHILGEMAKALSEARAGVNDNAPRITSFMIDKDKIRDVIGSGGKVIREICETTGAKVDITDDGTISVSAVDAEAGRAAVKMIEDIIEEPEVGAIYTGKVVNIVDFGAFVNYMGKSDGLVHVSEINDERVESVSDVLTEGQEVKVKLLEVERGKARLSMRAVNQETGVEVEGFEFTPAPKRERRPRRNAS